MGERREHGDLGDMSQSDHRVADVRRRSLELVILYFYRLSNLLSRALENLRRLFQVHAVKKVVFVFGPSRSN